MMRPCLACGEPTDNTRCDDCAPSHETNRKGSSRARGYDTNWDKLSKRARIMSPLCCDCGSTHDLQADHLPEAWERKAQGKPLRLQDIAVRCGAHNRAAGAARGHTVSRKTTPDQGRDPGTKTFGTPVSGNIPITVDPSTTLGGDSGARRT